MFNFFDDTEVTVERLKTALHACATEELNVVIHNSKNMKVFHNLHRKFISFVVALSQHLIFYENQW